ncbi:MAG: type I glutamate--ammonia ligase [Phycisphaerae bacterium]
MIVRTVRDVLALIRQQKIEFIDLRFMDFPGLWQHCTYPVSELREDSFSHGFGFDGSSIRGWQALNESDMLLIPVPETAVVDPFYAAPTLSMACDIRDPVTKREYSRDPRSIARKCEAYLRKTGIADEARFSPELEFFIFDHVHYDQSVNEAKYRVDSREGVWSRGVETATAPGNNLGNQIRLKEGYFPTPPLDSTNDLRSEMVQCLTAMGISVEGHHHEVATGGQCEIDLRHDTLVRMADKIMYAKYVVKNVAARAGKVATFMPKPLFQDNGSAMHTHFSLFKGGPLFAGRKYAGLSQLALYAIGGILKHSRSLLALTSPTTNSYKRLVPGYEAPTTMVYSSRNRTAAIRIPVYSANPQTKRLEFRSPDSSANPYLCFAAITMAALDGIQNKIDPGDPLDVDLSEISPERQAEIVHAPANLEEALGALAQDHDYLLKGNVFTPDVITGWIKYKTENEVQELRIRPHPFEFCMYFDI